MDFRSLPPVTMSVVVGTVSLTALEHFTSLRSAQFAYAPRLVFQEGQWWRIPITFFYLGPFSFSWLTSLSLFAQYSAELENMAIQHGGWPLNKSISLRTKLKIPYAIFIVLVFLSILAYPVTHAYPASYLTEILIGLFSHYNPNVELRLLGFISIQSAWLPWLSLGLNQGISSSMEAVLNGNTSMEWSKALTGILLSHIWWWSGEMLKLWIPKKVDSTLGGPILDNAIDNDVHLNEEGAVSEHETLENENNDTSHGNENPNDNTTTTDAEAFEVLEDTINSDSYQYQNMDGIRQRD
ncbi:hypothetical protein DAMA08_017100 [Martiniozyma asiatica (nom. inval.)]|nr:hypothetical protein DAMA08_017100 [Martiniozyma asiatica]